MLIQWNILKEIFRINLNQKFKRIIPKNYIKNLNLIRKANNL